MRIIDIKCDDCGFIWEGTLENFPKKCPKCLSTNIFRKWGVGVIDIAEGKVGNAETNYSNSITYHPSKFGRFKGIKK